MLELDSSDREWVFRSCESRFALRRWDAGFALLRKASKRYPRDTRHDVENNIDLILRLGEGRIDLRRHLARLIAIYDEARVMARLGDGLVRSLRRVDVRRLGSETLADRRDTWLDLGGGHAELEVPLRISGRNRVPHSKATRRSCSIS